MDGQPLFDFLLQLGIAGIGFTFFWIERKAHMDSIDKHLKEMREMQIRHNEDLREIAGMRQHLHRVQSFVRDNQTVPSSSEMMDIP